MSYKRLPVLCLTLILALGSQACSESNPGPSPSSSPSTPQFTVPSNVHAYNHWIATPALDLMGSDGTFARAFTEAYFLNKISTVRRDAGTYPGFFGANRTKNLPGGFDEDLFGSYTFWVPKMQVEASGNVSMTVCVYDNVSPSPRPPSLTVWELKYVRAGETPPAAQQGPARGPSTSKFGNWYATQFGSPKPKSASEIFLSDEEQERFERPCTSDMKDFDDRQFPTPGWPPANQESNAPTS